MSKSGAKSCGKVVPCRHGDVPVPELLDVEAAPVVQSAAVSHEAGPWQMEHGAVFGKTRHVFARTIRHAGRRGSLRTPLSQPLASLVV